MKYTCDHILLIYPSAAMVKEIQQKEASMKATKKMFVLNLVLAAMGSVALADGNSNTVTCLSDESVGEGLYKDHQAIMMTIDENMQRAHVEEYQVSLKSLCGVQFVRQSVLQKTEDARVQPGCGLMKIQSSLGSLLLPYDIQNNSSATLSKADTATEQFHCYNGTIQELESFLNDLP
jgi:hypothetical protein